MKIWLPLIILLLLVAQPVAANTAPIVRQSASQVDAATTSHIITLFATGMAPGDLTLACVELNNAAGGITYPTGWTAATLTTSDGFVTGFCLYRFFVAGDPSTMTVTTGNSIQDAAVVYQITGAAVVYRDFFGATGNDANPDPPALIVSPSDTVLAVESLFFGFSAFCHVTVYPSGFDTDIVASADDGGISARAAMSTRSETIGTENPGAATLNTACRWVTHTFAIGGPATPVSTGLTDVQIITFAMFMLTFVFLFALGMKVSALFHILAGIVAIFFAVTILTITGSQILSIVVAAIGVFVILFGLVAPFEGRGLQQ